MLSKVGSSDKRALRQSSKLLRRLVDRTITVAKGQDVSSARIATLVGACLPLQRLEITLPAPERPRTFGDTAWVNLLHGLQHASWPQLRDLSLAVPLTMEVAELLVSCKMPSLERFELHGGILVFPYERATPGRPTMLETLAGAAWPELRSLALREQRHLLAAGRPFAQAAWQLTRLELQGFRESQTNDLLRAAADKGWQLESLRLCRCYLRDAGAEFLAGAGWDLRELAVHHNSLSAAGAATLASSLVSASWPSLSSLDVSGNRLGDEGLARIALGDWPLLASLNICQVEMGREGARALAAASWPALEELLVSTFRGDHEVMRVALLESGWPADRVAAVLRASPLYF